MDAILLTALRALVDRHRLRIVARLATRPADAETLAAELRQPLPSVRHHLDMLLAAGLIEPHGEAARTVDPGRTLFAARLDRVGELGRLLAALGREEQGLAPAPQDGEWPHGGESPAETLARLRLTPDEVKVLRAHLVDGRLLTIPAQHARRDVILRFLAERVFTEDRAYPEKEVNQGLALFHPDVAALRRYLVDERYADRAAGLYRRRGPRPEAEPRP